MNRYPLWKYIVIAVSILLGLLYTLPNFFGESPAVQISPLRADVRTDTALLQRLEQVLNQQNLPYNGTILEATGIKIRFADTDTQIKAKDILSSEVGSDYVVALNLLPNSPQWMRHIGALPMYLGLDLRGGVHFMLQVDMAGALTKSLDRFSADLRSTLREQRIPSAGIERDRSKIIIRFRDEQAREKAITELGKAFEDLAFQSEEVGGEARLTISIKPEALVRMQNTAVQRNITTLRNRVNELGVAEPIIQQAGADRVIVQLPGVQDTAKAKDILGRTATLEVRMVDEEGDIDAALRGSVPPGTELFTERGGGPLLVKKQILLTGDRITDAQPGFDQDHQPAVHLTLDNNGSRIFKQLTRNNVGKRMAILLVEKNLTEVVTAPVIREEIGGGRVQISGKMSSIEARDVALLLRAGALAAPMEIVEERTIGPSLGAENISKGFNSTLFGFLAVATFIMAYYSAIGVISVVALAINLLFLIGLLSILQATLTLPGMAGMALTVGMAIDANVLINERIRDEIRHGASPQAAIHAGYERAWDAIIDTNLTTLLAGLGLMIFGSGPIKGFAVVLCLGILTTLFSAVTVSRAMVNLLYGNRKLARVPIGTIKISKKSSNKH
ncbi:MULTISPECIES: protein translocase subunit SecD [Nitrosomonas]|uniref:Protein translocase subunit SecD n=2 Tax=Nitrosomonas eutropha TaxID=916 RepID=A0ABX5MBQ9_9PROT|nr:MULTISPECIES: protein translocase subunit SecD [Nitrosomonas]ABI59679.1 protein-export membrane protein SecD [Nitrosomonas eutropha C91]MXS80227.1 protein translocase subunit SecD [Nitrosomonas sp. GH22]PXV82522.1 preprotein translocase subunit SecD [Nitrosomonas eutropha]SCX00909.1 preprotein translocase subunit SecD [Nitrosomonas eutropha]SDW34043.1 preprotein translocase subunit SecD [Nitrosomonas eutropha]